MKKVHTYIFVTCPLCGWQSTATVYSAMGYEHKLYIHWTGKHCNTK